MRTIPTTQGETETSTLLEWCTTQHWRLSPSWCLEERKAYTGCPEKNDRVLNANDCTNIWPRKSM